MCAREPGMILYSSQTFASFRGIIMGHANQSRALLYIFLSVLPTWLSYYYSNAISTKHFATAFRAGLNRKISFLPTGEMQLMSMCGIFFSLYLNCDRLTGASNPKTVGVLCCWHTSKLPRDSFNFDVFLKGGYQIKFLLLFIIWLCLAV
jgi:hypothetical protein